MDSDDVVYQPVEHRRLPVYLILWCSARVAGQPLADELNAVDQLLSALRSEPEISGIAYISLITVGSTEIHLPLTPLDQFTVPQLEATGPARFAKALRVLEASLEHDAASHTAEHIRYYRPLVCVFMSGKPADDWRDEANQLERLGRIRRLHIIGAALDSEAREALADLTADIVPVRELAFAVRSSFQWMSGATPSEDTGAVEQPLSLGLDDFMYSDWGELKSELGTGAASSSHMASNDSAAEDSMPPGGDDIAASQRGENLAEKLTLSDAERERVQQLLQSLGDIRFGGVEGVALSPDGQAALDESSVGGALRIWNMPSEGHSFHVTPRGEALDGPASLEGAPDVSNQHEQVTFTAYHPKELPLHTWAPLVIYISLDTPEQQEQVESQATERLGANRDLYRPASSNAPTKMRRGSMLTFVPKFPGLRVNPPTLTVAWEEDIQQVEFRIRADHLSPGHAINGVIQVFAGPLLRADIPVSIFILSQVPQEARDDNLIRVLARAYRRVFASYSHRDTSIVRACETAVETIGDRYLRDVRLLRSGEQWDERLLAAIGEADVFQLFWSRRAAQSPNVEREWRHALSLAATRNAFIRPVYWSRRPYRVPAELHSIHFEQLDLATLGMGAIRRFIYVMTS